MERADVFISGGGIAGLATAGALADLGLSVVLADPAPPQKTGATPDTTPGADLRSTAYLQPAKALFERAGLWDDLAPFATPLETLQVVDTTGQPPEVTATRAFDSSDLSDAPFGWNIPNWRARAVLTAAMGDRVDMRLGVGFKSILTRDSEARVTLTDGTKVAARLVLAADGRNSPVRTALGLGVRTTRYGQTALAFCVTHDIAHHNVSTEVYNSGGAFTLVPLGDIGQRPASAVVWMNAARDAQAIANLPEADFNARATERSTGVLGVLTRVGGMGHWPVITQTARALTAPRVALMAEAAHVMPPIGAQGLNTSLQDVTALIDALGADPGDPGAPAVLQAFDTARRRDITLRAGAIDLFNRVCQSGAPSVQALRSAGLKLVHDVAPLRRAVMTAGLGRQPQ
ncbi:MAG: FAD-dependent monooxygenase [Pseudomonadota bacterium]